MCKIPGAGGSRTRGGERSPGCLGSQMDRERGKDEAQKSTEVRPQGQEAVVNF